MEDGESSLASGCEIFDMSIAYGNLCLMPLQLATEPTIALAPDLGDHGVAEVASWFDQHGPFLLRVVTRLVGNPATAEDVVQETFLIAHRRRSEVASYANIRGWLYRVAANLVRHQRRSIARRLRLEQALTQAQEQLGQTGDPSPLGALEVAQRAQQVRDCVAQLPLKQREVFVMFELEGVEGTTIAQLLGIPENTVWTRLHHARKRFRVLWDRLAQNAGTP